MTKYISPHSETGEPSQPRKWIKYHRSSFFFPEPWVFPKLKNHISTPCRTEPHFTLNIQIWASYWKSLWNLCSFCWVWQGCRDYAGSCQALEMVPHIKPRPCMSEELRSDPRTHLKRKKKSECGGLYLESHTRETETDRLWWDLLASQSGSKPERDLVSENKMAHTHMVTPTSPMSSVSALGECFVPHTFFFSKLLSSKWHTSWPFAPRSLVGTSFEQVCY